MKLYMVFKILIWCMSWYTYIWYMLGIWYFLTFNLVYTIVYNQYMLRLQRMTRKMMVTENVWSDFIHSGICAVYKNRAGILSGKRLFFIPPQCSIPEAMRNDYFWLVYVLYTAKQYVYSDLFICCAPSQNYTYLSQ